jgi:hypothetical protein
MYVGNILRLHVIYTFYPSQENKITGLSKCKTWKSSSVLNYALG